MYTADKRMVLAALKIKKAMRALSVPDHHLFFFWRYWKLSMVKHISAIDRANMMPKKTLVSKLDVITSRVGI